MDKEKKIYCEHDAGPLTDLQVPGIDQVIELLRHDFPSLSEEAICRILGINPRGALAMKNESRIPETSISIVEVK